MPSAKLTDRQLGRRVLVAVLACAWLYGLAEQFPNIEHVINYCIATLCLVAVARWG